MAKITREQIQGLTVEEPLKIELLGLFDGITEREQTITNLQSKVPKDSQRVVEEVDFQAFTKAQSELAAYKQKLAEKLATEQPVEGGFEMPFLKLFCFTEVEKKN